MRRLEDYLLRTNLEIRDRYKDIIYPIAVFVAIIIIWQAIVVCMDIPGYLLPAPSDIVSVFFTDTENLMKHAWITTYEAVTGFFIAVVISILIGIVMDFIPIVRKSLYPLMLTTQMIPTITIAPLLVIWFGFGMLPKVLMVTLTCFFPILISFVDGLENIDKDYLNLFKTMKAGKIDTFRHLKFPMSMEKFFSGLKISATYAVMAATVAEWLGGTEGLGVYMLRSKKAYALDKVFASTILIVILSLIFVGIVHLVRKSVLKKYNK
ncbi:ABC transporter permease [Peptacetobacter hominis]|uniref:ABC transporter permease n=1 Tax=Peptacetobacter hominis TaxID=2743610 RepID=A0A544QVS3_9FIRM|nr:ABC transporter permease [Peptacetobacter hominis]